MYNSANSLVEFSIYVEKYKKKRKSHIPKLQLQTGEKKKMIDKVNETHCDDLQASMSQRLAMGD